MGDKPGKPQETPVILEPYAFSSVLVSAIEVYSRESLGFLIGHRDRQFVGGRMTDCLSVRACYPMQSAARGRTMVGFGNLAARKRAVDTVRAVGFELVGGFHSHPNCSPRLSKEDIDTIREELEEEYCKIGLKEWLEIVVAVEKIDRPKKLESLRKLLIRHNNSEFGFYPRNTEPWIVGDVVVGRKLAYRVRVAGFLSDKDWTYEILLCYSRY